MGEGTLTGEADSRETEAGRRDTAMGGGRLLLDSELGDGEVTLDPEVAGRPSCFWGDLIRDRHERRRVQVPPTASAPSVKTPGRVQNPCGEGVEGRVREQQQDKGVRWGRRAASRVFVRAGPRGTGSAWTNTCHLADAEVSAAAMRPGHALTALPYVHNYPAGGACPWP